jgi:hypothetical protein
MHNQGTNRVLSKEGTIYRKMKPTVTGVADHEHSIFKPAGTDRVADQAG